EDRQPRLAARAVPAREGAERSRRHRLREVVRQRLDVRHRPRGRARLTPCLLARHAREPVAGRRAPGKEERERESGRGNTHAGDSAAYDRPMDTLDRSTIWPYEGGDVGAFYYQRNAHPTGAAAERALGELDGGHALLFPSGAGATTALALAFLSPGDTIALAKGAYFGTGVTFAQLERWRVPYVEFDQTAPPPDGVPLVWVEA